jgi:hypothetical protein
LIDIKAVANIPILLPQDQDLEEVKSIEISADFIDRWSRWWRSGRR